MLLIKAKKKEFHGKKLILFLWETNIYNVKKNFKVKWKKQKIKSVCRSTNAWTIRFLIHTDNSHVFSINTVRILWCLAAAANACWASWWWTPLKWAWVSIRWRGGISWTTAMAKGDKKKYRIGFRRIEKRIIITTHYMAGGRTEYLTIHYTQGQLTIKTKWIFYSCSIVHIYTILIMVR